MKVFDRANLVLGMEKDKLLNGSIQSKGSLPIISGQRRRNKLLRCLCRDNFPCIPARFILAGMLFSGFLTMYALRVNMSVAIVAMVNSSEFRTSVHDADKGNAHNTTSSGDCRPSAPMFRWTGTEQAWILSSFFYGYTISQIPGGYLATRLSAKHMMGLGVFVPAILTLLTPLAALSTSIAPVVLLRVLEGVFQGFVFPSQGAILGKWSPPLERSRLNAICNAGSYIGAIVTFPLAGWLCSCGFAGGWPSAFYTFGMVGVVWYFLWLFLVYDTPASHPRISQKELKYIQTALQTEEKEKVTSVPWLRMLTSWPFWAIFCAFVCNDWGFYILLTCLPTFLKDTLPNSVDIKKDGLLSGIPYASMAVVALLWSTVTDFAISKGLPVVVARKINTGMGMTLPAFFLIICGYFGNNITVAVVLISLALGGEGFNVAGYATSALDIAPRYAGIIIGIANSASSACGIVAPHIVKLITTADTVDQLQQQWREVFIIAAEVYLFGGIMFALLASGRVQEWAKKKEPTSQTFRILDVTVSEEDNEILSFSINEDSESKTAEN